jgi:hypothetical protein
VPVTGILVLWRGDSVGVVCVVIALALNWTVVENAKRVVAPVRPMNRVTPSFLHKVADTTGKAEQRLHVNRVEGM